MPGIEFETGNLTIAIMQSDGFGLEFKSHKHPIEFRVDDFDAAKSELESRGVEFEGDEAAARGAAMQIAAMKAQYLTRDEVPADLVESERSIAEQKTREEGKPEQAIAKIVEGRLGGFYKEIVLLEQESVTEAKKTVKSVLDAAGTTVKRFARFEVGA